MKELMFDIYIGIKTEIKQSEKIVATVIPKFFIPFGKNLDGTSKNTGHEFFFNLYDLSTYISDWFDLVDESQVSATIYLNIISLKRKIYGKEIVAVINMLNEMGNYKELRNFNFLQEIK